MAMEKAEDAEMTPDTELFKAAHGQLEELVDNVFEILDQDDEPEGGEG